MATSGNRLGDAVVDALKAAGFYSPDATGAQEARSRAEWKVIATTILAELKVNQDLVLQNNDIPVASGSFEDSLHAPVTGVGESVAVILTGRTN